MILSINTSRLFAEGSVIPPEHRLMLVNFHRECIGDAKKSPVGPRHKLANHQIRRQAPHIKWAVSLVIACGHFWGKKFAYFSVYISGVQYLAFNGYSKLVKYFTI